MQGIANPLRTIAGKPKGVQDRSRLGRLYDTNLQHHTAQVKRTSTHCLRLSQISISLYTLIAAPPAGRRAL